VWNLLSEAKHGRVMLLTTHSMEEADVLGDRYVVYLCLVCMCCRYLCLLCVMYWCNAGQCSCIQEFVAMHSSVKNLLIEDFAAVLLAGTPCQAAQALLAQQAEIIEAVMSKRH